MTILLAILAPIVGAAVIMASIAIGQTIEERRMRRLGPADNTDRLEILRRRFLNTPEARAELEVARRNAAIERAAYDAAIREGLSEDAAMRVSDAVAEAMG